MREFIDAVVATIVLGGLVGVVVFTLITMMDMLLKLQ